MITTLATNKNSLVVGVEVIAKVMNNKKRRKGYELGTSTNIGTFTSMNDGSCMVTPSVIFQVRLVLRSLN